VVFARGKYKILEVFCLQQLQVFTLQAESGSFATVCRYCAEKDGGKV
jgi:hypothetical protein